jgi:hypothetical protein
MKNLFNISSCINLINNNFSFSIKKKFEFMDQDNSITPMLVIGQPLNDPISQLCQSVGLAE